MSYRLPPLNGLRAFEASARHLSFRRAADELHVTPGAVSQQVKSLEASIGVKLFRRLPRGLLLTAAGEDYLPSISRAFGAISEATDSVAPTPRGRRWRFAISPTLPGTTSNRFSSTILTSQHSTGFPDDTQTRAGTPSVTGSTFP